MRFTWLYRGLSADTIIPHNEIYMIISRSQCRHNHSSQWDLHDYIEVSVQTQSFLTMRFTWLYRGLSADTIIPHNEIYMIISRSQCRHNHSSQWDYTLYRGLSADTIIPHNEIYMIISRSQCRHNHSPDEIYIISRSRWDLHDYIEVSVQTQSFLTTWLYRGLSADTIIPHDEIYMIISRSQCKHNHSSQWDIHDYIEVSVQTQSFLTRSQCRPNHSSQWY